MFKFFILLFLISGQAKAEECLKQAWTVDVSSNVFAHIERVLEDLDNINEIHKVCQDQFLSRSLTNDVEEKIFKFHSVYQEYTRKGDISSNRFFDLGLEFKEEIFLTEREICPIVQKGISFFSECRHKKEYYKEILRTDFTKFNFKDFCEQNVTRIYRIHRACKGKR